MMFLQQFLQVMGACLESALKPRAKLVFCLVLALSASVSFALNIGLPVSQPVIETSADGTAVIGLDNAGFRWTPSSFVRFIHPVTGEPLVPTSISNDGKTVAGLRTVPGTGLMWNGAQYSYYDGAKLELWRWTEATGVQILGVVPHSWDWTYWVAGPDVSEPVRFDDSFYISDDGTKLAWFSPTGFASFGRLGPIDTGVPGPWGMGWYWNGAQGFVEARLRVGFFQDGSVSTLSVVPCLFGPLDPVLEPYRDDLNWSLWSNPTDEVVVSDPAAWLNLSLSDFHARHIFPDGPVIEKLSPSRANAGAGDVALTIYGLNFEEGSRVLFGGTEVNSTWTGWTQPGPSEPPHVPSLEVSVPSSFLPSTSDFATVPVNVVSPSGEVSKAAAFTIVGTGVGTLVQNVESTIITPGAPVTVSIPAPSPSSSGVSATLTLSGEAPATVTLATYTADPSSAANTSFQVAGQFLDLNASGVTAADSMVAYFYFPAGTSTENLALKFWNSHATPAAWETVSPTVTDTTQRRIQVTFNNTSHPKITELDGTFFAAGRDIPIQFTGFLSPIGGADQTGGSASSPLRTFKLGSTIPVKFTAIRGGNAVTTGIQKLQVQLFSSSTTSAPAIDATPQGAATTGNEFRYANGQWQFNLDTKATSMSRGVWKITATLSDESQHSTWVQLK
jgi:hypothetical protein